MLFLASIFACSVQRGFHLVVLGFGFFGRVLSAVRFGTAKEREEGLE